MFCAQCGTEVDADANFCKNCGARVARSVGPAETVAPPASSVIAGENTPRAADSAGATTRKARHDAPFKEGASSRTLMIVVGVLVLVLVGAGAYFITGSFKPAEPVLPPSSPAQEPLASKAPASDPSPSFPVSKEPRAEAEDPAALPKFDSGPEPRVEKPRPAPDALPPPSRSQPQRPTQDPGRGSRPAPVLASRGGANPGTYETVRSTPVHEDPSPSSRVVANIPAGVRVNVVSSSGDWLEVHSRRGNPPGFIRRGDAVVVESSN